MIPNLLLKALQTERIALFILLLISSNSFGQTYTIVTQASFTNMGFSSSAWGDYDNDGDLDLFLSGVDNLSVKHSQLYRNNGDSTFTDMLIPFTDISNGSSAWGDYDRDGDLDLLVTGSSTSNTKQTIVYNNNAGSFSDAGLALTGVVNSSCNWVDYDNDGDLDIFISGTDPSNTIVTKIYKNTTNSFSPITHSITAVTNCSAAWGDYNKDGYTDLILTGTDASNNKTCKVYKNNKAGILTDLLAVGLTGVTFGSIAWGDYDSDSDLDFAVVGTDNTNARICKIYRYISGNSFTNIGATLTGLATSSLSWGDYDNDGDLDLLTGGFNGTSSVNTLYRNDNGTFNNSGIGYFGTYSNSVNAVDFDNDNDVDLFISGFGTSGPICTLYRNKASTTNTLPSIPTNTAETISEDTARLSWNTSTDGQTASTGLTYTIYVTTSKTAVNILSPSSNTTNGYRKVVTMGNAGLKNSFEIKGLDQGKYYWSVQSVDNSFSASVFAPLDSFVICRKFSLGNDTSICFKDSIFLTAGKAGDVVNWYSYLNPLIATNQLSIKPEITADDTIWAQRNNSVSGCLTYDTIVVKVNPVSIINQGSDTTICDKSTIQLGGTPTATGSILPYTYRWTPGVLLDDSTIANPIALTPKDTTFRLIVKAGSCKPDTVFVLISLNVLPQVVASRDTFIGAGETLSLLASGSSSYIWYPTTGLSNNQVANPEASPIENTQYVVTGTDVNGCKNKDTVNVVVKNDLFIPDLFSPDGNGTNEAFKIFGAGIKEIDFKVYNRYGEVIFESSDLDELLRKGWDGTFKGTPQTTGTYLWTMKGKTYDGTELKYKGKKTGMVVLKR